MLSSPGMKAVLAVILRVEDNAGAVKALQEGKIEILSEEKIYSL